MKSKPRQTTCKICGAPRGDKAKLLAMCNEHYAEYWNHHKRVGGTYNKRDHLEDTYARLGLSVGNVWSKVLR